MATATYQPNTESPHSRPTLLNAGMVWSTLVVIFSLWFAFNIFTGKTFDVRDTLGDTVQYFFGFLALIPALLGGLSLAGFFQNPYAEAYPTLRLGFPIGQRFIGLKLDITPLNGRNAFLTLNYLGLVLGSFYLLHLWGVFIAFDEVAGAIYDNRVLLWGLVAAYFIFWLSGRFSEDSRVRPILELLALGGGSLTLIALLLQSDVFSAFTHIIGKYEEPLVWTTTIIMGIFGFFTLSILSLKDYFPETPDQRTTWQGWLMVSPNIIGFGLFLAGPLLLSLYLSFTDATVNQVPQFNNFQNYIDIFSLRFEIQDETEATQAINAVDEGFSYAGASNLNDTQRVVIMSAPQPLEISMTGFPAVNTTLPQLNIVTQDLIRETYPQEALSGDYNVVTDFGLTSSGKRFVIGAKDARFWLSLQNTIVFCLLLVPLSTIPAILLATILDSKLPGVQFYRAIYFLPSIAAVVGTALIWRTALYPQNGYINYALGEVTNGLNMLTGANLEAPVIGWLSDPDMQLFSVVLLTAWQVVGFNTVLFLAGLQGIPTVLYEAASVDGANRWQQFHRITLPLLAPTTFFVVITTVINALQVFNEVFVLYPGQQVPDTVSTGVYHLYNKGFKGFEFGYASAVAWVIFALIFSVTLIQFRVSRSDETQ